MSIQGVRGRSPTVVHGCVIPKPHVFSGGARNLASGEPPANQEPRFAQ